MHRRPFAALGERSRCVLNKEHPPGPVCERVSVLDTLTSAPLCPGRAPTVGCFPGQCLASVVTQYQYTRLLRFFNWFTQATGRLITATNMPSPLAGHASLWMVP